MKHYYSFNMMFIAAASFFAVVLVLSIGVVSADEHYHRYEMDHHYFSCQLPTDWHMEREKEKDEEYHIYEIMLTKPTSWGFSASIHISFYAKDNEDFTDYADFLERNSRNALGETKSAREKYGPVRKIRLESGTGFEIERELQEYLSLQGKSDASVTVRELLYVLPAISGGFYVLHFTAPKEFFEGLLPVFRRVVSSFAPGK